MLIAVRDAGALAAPALTRPGPRAEHGRGLAIVAALVADLGSEPAGTGRSTWCRLTPKPAEQAAVTPRQRRAARASEREPEEPGWEKRSFHQVAWVAVTWVNPDLVGRIQRDGTPVSDMRPGAMKRQAEPAAELETDREAEP